MYVLFILYFFNIFNGNNSFFLFYCIFYKISLWLEKDKQKRIVWLLKE
jgi:hypothetical protein